VTLLKLSGCAPEPIASYLKGLAVLRLVSTQVDPDALGFWRGGCFHLESTLGERELLSYFLDRYNPTPIVAPWGGGSGFYGGDPRNGLDRILNSPDPRFKEYREAIQTIQSWPELPKSSLSLRQMIANLENGPSEVRGNGQDGTGAIVRKVQGLCSALTPAIGNADNLDLTVEQIESADPPASLSSNELTRWESQRMDLKHAGKKLRSKHNTLTRRRIRGSLLRLCRDRLGDRTIEWVDAAVMFDGERKPYFPPLLGTGGNEGHLNYSSAFMDHVTSVLCSGPSGSSEPLLRASLFGSRTESLVRHSVGQLDPGRAGGFNQGNGVEDKNQPMNPWDFILLMEGAICWSSSITRRARVGIPPGLSSPFTVRSSPVGYPSSSEGDGGRAQSEVWAPLWPQPTGYPEVKMFIGEGRAEVGPRPPKNGVEFAEAVASLGIDRGVQEFVRYSILQRRGESYVVAALSRFPVLERRESELIRELDAILERIDSALARSDKVPARYLSARRALDQCKYDVLLGGGKPAMKAMVVSIGQFERLLASKDPEKSPKVRQPPSGLRIVWLEACNDRTLEVRLAASLASMGGFGGVGPLRSNLEPVDPKGPWKWDASGTQVSWRGASVCDRLSATISRRVQDAERLGVGNAPFRGLLRVPAEDISAFIDGDLDERVFENLVFGFSWVDWGKARNSASFERICHDWALPVTDRPIDRAWASMKPLFMDQPPRLEGSPGDLVADPRIIPLLRAGRVDAAHEVARRRLRSCGFLVPAADFLPGPRGRRIAGALLFPVSQGRWLAEALGTKGQHMNI